MPVYRSRVGCFTCRRRKKKCSEHKPICQGCRRNDLSCVWPTIPGGESLPHHKLVKPAQGDVGRSLVEESDSAMGLGAVANHSPEPFDDEVDDQDQQEQQSVQIEPFSVIEWQFMPTVDILPTDISNVSIGSITNLGVCDLDVGASSHDLDHHSSTLSQHGTPHCAVSEPSLQLRNSSDSVGSNQRDHVQSETSLASLEVCNRHVDIPENADWAVGSSVNYGIPTGPMQGFDEDSYQLLTYYLMKTANSMGNGSTDSNPFVAHLIPLAFSTPVILQLILTQSAVHRKASNDDYSSIDVATQHYIKSLQLFRDGITLFSSGSPRDRLLLTFGSLTMSLTEVARGDIEGTIFDHLVAAEFLVSELLDEEPQHSSQDLMNFVIEYIIHMSSTSILSIDAQYASQPLLAPKIVQVAESLAGTEYVGQLCGSWLQLLVLVPQIFLLGQSFLQSSISPDHFIAFGLLQSKILGFVPPKTSHSATVAASLVFKQATLLYLWSMLTQQGEEVQGQDTPSHSHITLVVEEAMSLLEQIPLTSRVNTSLCWPLTVVGCCTKDPEIQRKLRYRLQSMSLMLGLGNIKAALDLMERVWADRATDLNPWTLCKSMQKYDIWLSCA